MGSFGGGEGGREKLVLMWGYLPGSTPDRSPLLSPAAVRLPNSFAGDKWKDVWGGGCGFAMATSESGKLITWGSTDDQGQSYLTSGKHEEIPEAFPLPSGVSIVNASAGWAHCSVVTGQGEIYTWGWKECVPSGKVLGDQSIIDKVEKDALVEQVSPRSQVLKNDGEDSTKRRRLSLPKPTSDSLVADDDTSSAVPCLVAVGVGVKINMVAAGGRHVLALSDIGQVWSWGYGGEGQLGLGTRIRLATSPHPVPCNQRSTYGKDRSVAASKALISSTRVNAVACGGRHSAIVTDAGALLTFGWGLHGQCGQGSMDDELSPTCVSSLLGIQIKNIAAGLWHTVCISSDGNVYAFGGNQFGQLGTGTDHAETLPKLLNSTILKSKNAEGVSCGARHSAVITDEGEVFCWGWNKYGQLGLGDSTDRNVPIQVPLSSCLPKKVCCGWWHTLLLVDSLS